jgi:hypothetical protein
MRTLLYVEFGGRATAALQPEAPTKILLAVPMKIIPATLMRMRILGVSMEIGDSMLPNRLQGGLGANGLAAIAPNAIKTQLIDAAPAVLKKMAFLLAQ